MSVDSAIREGQWIYLPIYLPINGRKFGDVCPIEVQKQ